jgi:L-lactate dehydrogenase complex protein LldF
MRALARVFASRRRYEAAQRAARLGRWPVRHLPVGPLRAWATTRDLPDVPDQSFREWWRERGA